MVKKKKTAVKKKKSQLPVKQPPQKTLAEKVEEFGRLIHQTTRTMGPECQEASEGHSLSASIKTKALLEQFVEEKMKASHRTAALEKDVLDELQKQIGSMSPHALSSLLGRLAEKTQNDLAVIFGIKLQRAGGNNAPHVPGGILGGVDNEPHQTHAQESAGVGGAKMMKSLTAIFTSIVDEVRKSDMNAKIIDVEVEKGDGKS